MKKRAVTAGAIAFVIIMIAFGILMPEVLHALSAFLLTLFTKGTAFLNALPVNPAMMSQVGR